jgi:hypothetical protein
VNYDSLINNFFQKGEIMNFFNLFKSSKPMTQEEAIKAHESDPRKMPFAITVCTNNIKFTYFGVFRSVKDAVRDRAIKFDRNITKVTVANLLLY